MEQEMTRSEKRRRARKIRKGIGLWLLAGVSLAAVIYAAVHLLGYYADYRSEKTLEKELLQLRESAEPVATQAGATPDGSGEDRAAEQLRSFYNRMKQKNEDYVCWITLEGAGIDYPVVKRDNAFYLNHDFEGEQNRHGSVFVDENCDAGDDVLLLHGHHMKDGTMFGGLKKFKDSEFCETNREIVLEFAEERIYYRVFAVAQIDLLTEGSFAFEVLPETPEEKAIYIEGLDRASFWFDEAEVSGGVENSSFVILSTCDYGTDEQRLLVAAKKIE